jgi:uncharacterized protein YbaR (Trm112 family)
MLDAGLIELLCCPDSRQPVSLADRSVVGKLNSEIAAGRVKNRAGVSVTEPVEAVLVREDGRVCYPVRHGLPVMLVEEAIELPGSSD